MKKQAAKFRSLLKSTCLSQRALAERLGVATTTVNRWAQGGLPVPKYAVAYLTLLVAYEALNEGEQPCPHSAF